MISGFSVTFRQFYGRDDSIRVRNVYGLLVRAAREAWGEEGEDWDQLTLWGKAEGQLRSAPLRVLVGRKLRQVTGEALPVANDYPPYPEELISLYANGRSNPRRRRDELNALTSTPFDLAWQQYRFGKAVSGLAHLYIGFSGVVRAVLGKNS